MSRRLVPVTGLGGRLGSAYAWLRNPIAHSHKRKHGAHGGGQTKVTYHNG